MTFILYIVSQDLTTLVLSKGSFLEKSEVKIIFKREVTILDQYVWKINIETVNGYTAVFTANGS